MQKHASRYGFDGASWIIEGVKKTNHHYVEKWLPENGEFKELCLFMLKLSGEEIGELY